MVNNDELTRPPICMKIKNIDTKRIPGILILTLSDDTMILCKENYLINLLLKISKLDHDGQQDIILCKEEYLINFLLKESKGLSIDHEKRSRTS